MKLSRHKQVGRRVLDFVFPPACQLCGVSFSTLSGGTCFCEPCEAAISRVATHTCDRCCAVIGPYSNTAAGCVHCRKFPFRFDSVTCLGMYEGDLRQAILSAKWAFSSVAIDTLAGLLHDRTSEEFADARPDIVLPIPQAWQTRVHRRLNQAARIGNVLAKRMNIPCDEHILCRRRNSRPQKRVAAADRYDNQKDSFRLKDEFVIDGANVLLTDDVLTTGATCSEAAKILKAAGARTVTVAVLGRVLSPR